MQYGAKKRLGLNGKACMDMLRDMEILTIFNCPACKSPLLYQEYITRELRSTTCITCGIVSLTLNWNKYNDKWIDFLTV